VQEFTTQRWREILAHNGLAGFDDVWNLAHAWVEPPNTRHRGFGGVARHEFAAPEGGRVACYVKLHRNRLRRTALRPWRGTPALSRELANHRRCAAAGVASPAPLYCASRRVDGELRGLFVTEELTGFRPLAQLLAEWHAAPVAAPSARRPVLEAVAAQLRALHGARLVARSYTAEHVYVGTPAAAGDGARPEVRLIDLERIKRVALRRRARARDLVTLQLATPSLGRGDRLRFLLAYLGSERFTPAARRVWERVAADAEAKLRRRRAARDQASSKGR
jgi:hypothetical protein